MSPLFGASVKRELTVAGSPSLMKYLKPIRNEDGPSRVAKSDEPSSLVETGTRLDFDLVGVAN